MRYSTRWEACAIGERQIMQEKIGKVRWFFRGILITLMIINSAYGQVRQRGKYKFRHENLTLEQIQTIYRDTSKQMDNLMEDYNMTDKVYLALYKHKRSFRKEPLKAATDAKLNPPVATTINRRQYTSAFRRLYKMAVCAVKKST